MNTNVHAYAHAYPRTYINAHTQTHTNVWAASEGTDEVFSCFTATWQKMGA